MNIKQIEKLAEECDIGLFYDPEGDYFDGSVESLKLFAEKVIEEYEDTLDDEHFTSYGKKGDWE